MFDLVVIEFYRFYNTYNTNLHEKKIVKELPSVWCMTLYAQVERMDGAKDAVLECAHSSDVGYDVSIRSVDRTANPSVIKCHTGLRIVPPDGYHFELYARSSLWKRGYMLANSVGIIDPEYRGELIVMLYKFDETTPHITNTSLGETGLKACQLVLRKTEHCEINYVTTIDMDTERGEGGFGSTGM